MMFIIAIFTSDLNTFRLEERTMIEENIDFSYFTFRGLFALSAIKLKTKKEVLDCKEKMEILFTLNHHHRFLRHLLLIHRKRIVHLHSHLLPRDEKNMMKKNLREFHHLLLRLVQR